MAPGNYTLKFLFLNILMKNVRFFLFCRYMMLILKQNEIYFFDRNNSCFKVHNLTFVKANNINDHLENTLVDGVS